MPDWRLEEPVVDLESFYGVFVKFDGNTFSYFTLEKGKEVPYDARGTKTPQELLTLLDKENNLTAKERDEKKNPFLKAKPSMQQNISLKPGVEISSNAKDLAAALTNPTELAKSKGNLTESYPVEFRGKKYKDAEAAYQALKSTATKDEGPNSTYNLMVEIIKAKLQQYPRLVSEITKQGGSAWILSSTHQPTKQNTVWETGGKNWFIKALNDAYLSVQPKTLQSGVGAAEDDIDVSDQPDAEKAKKVLQDLMNRKKNLNKEIEDRKKEDDAGCGQG
jgi:hypothetical protein